MSLAVAYLQQDTTPAVTKGWDNNHGRPRRPRILGWRAHMEGATPLRG